MFTPELLKPTWWTEIGLAVPNTRESTGNERARVGVALEVLASIEPTGFALKGGAGSQELSLEEVKRRVLAAQTQHDVEVAARAEDRRLLGWQKINEAFAAHDADEVITEGKWEGMTHARAISRCWNLFQYEPRGFTSPNNIVRANAVKELENGGMPEVFGYPQRAKELEARGLTPRSYRTHQEALGKKTFSQGDVSYS